jgi:hypothetical protein
VIFHLSLLSFGDNLISLSLLARLHTKSGVVIAGTALTQRIASFVPTLGIPITVVSEHVPAFYDVRKRGIVDALQEAVSVRRKLARLSSRGDGFILEKSDPRRHVLVGGRDRRSWVPDRGKNVYEDRRNLLNAVFEDDIALTDAPRLERSPRTVAINPSSRVRAKEVSPQTLRIIVAYLRERSIDVHLMDPERAHGALRSAVSSYHTGTTMSEAVALVEACDLYIGADSLFVHFAYHCRTPSLVLYNQTNLYFAPPGVAAQGSFVEFVARMGERELCAALDNRLAARDERLPL